MILIHYPKCSTCKKAAKWLTDNGHKFETRDIVIENPKEEELKKWLPLSGLPMSRMFNTSGIKYRELNLKEVVKTAKEEELFKLLASDGKLVKRPILIVGDNVIFGFNEKNWCETLNKTTKPVK